MYDCGQSALTVSARTFVSKCERISSAQNGLLVLQKCLPFVCQYKSHSVFRCVLNNCTWNTTDDGIQKCRNSNGSCCCRNEHMCRSHGAPWMSLLLVSVDTLGPAVNIFLNFYSYFSRSTRSFLKLKSTWICYTHTHTQIQKALPGKLGRSCSDTFFCSFVSNGHSLQCTFRQFQFRIKTILVRSLHVYFVSFYSNVFAGEFCRHRIARRTLLGNNKCSSVQ